MHTHTQSTHLFFPSSFCPCVNSLNAKTQLAWVHHPVNIQDLEENSIRFHWAVHYTVKHGCTPWNTSPREALCYGPRLLHNSTSPMPRTRGPGNAGDISPGRQSCTDGQCVFPLPVWVTEQTAHSLPLFCTVWEGGRTTQLTRLRPMAQVFREDAQPAFNAGS